MFTATNKQLQQTLTLNLLGLKGLKKNAMGAN